MAKKREHLQEYSDKQGELSMEYYDLFEQFDYSRDDLTVAKIDHIKARLAFMMKEEPIYLDPYLLLHDMLLEEDNVIAAYHVLDKAYNQAIELITDKKGNWADTIEWLWLENRPIIRTLMRQAEKLWDLEGKKEEAKEIYTNLLQVNPNDNTGARYPLLAILEGMSFENYYKTFMGWNEEVGIVHKNNCEPWFNKESEKYKEFDKWRAAMKEFYDE